MSETIQRLDRLKTLIDELEIYPTYQRQLKEIITDIQTDIPNEFPYYFDK